MAPAITFPTYAREGAKVPLTDVNLEAARAEAAKLGGNAIGFALDVRDEAGWAAAVAEAQSRFGPLTILVNNAGVLSHGPMRE